MSFSGLIIDWKRARKFVEHLYNRDIIDRATASSLADMLESYEVPIEDIGVYEVKELIKKYPDEYRRFQTIRVLKGYGPDTFW